MMFDCNHFNFLLSLLDHLLGFLDFQLKKYFSHHYFVFNFGYHLMNFDWEPMIMQHSSLNQGYQLNSLSDWRIC